VVTDLTLNGKWALVTGATAGLGEAVATSLAAAGANVVLHDLREPKETAGRLRTRFRVQVVSIGADLSERKAIEAMMADLLGHIGAIDILVNNAVVRHFAPVEAFPPEKWDEALAVNLSAPFHLIRLALPAMKRRNWGRIINMASIYSTRAITDRIDYVTTKTAILGVTRAVALETATTGITCNAVCPGTLQTPAIEGKITAAANRAGQSIEDATGDYLSTRQPSRRFIALDGVGAMVVFLASDAARDITGAMLPIDGGWAIA
jgi:3-hydroxybutyrate dehydrogenase